MAGDRPGTEHCVLGRAWDAHRLCWASPWLLSLTERGSCLRAAAWPAQGVFWRLPTQVLPCALAHGSPR